LLDLADVRAVGDGGADRAAAFDDDESRMA
jgi:hypothetical protein